MACTLHALRQRNQTTTPCREKANERWESCHEMPPNPQIDSKRLAESVKRGIRSNPGVRRHQRFRNDKLLYNDEAPARKAWQGNSDERSEYASKCVQKALDHQPFEQTTYFTESDTTATGTCVNAKVAIRKIFAPDQRYINVLHSSETPTIIEHPAGFSATTIANLSLSRRKQVYPSRPSQRGPPRTSLTNLPTATNGIPQHVCQSEQERRRHIKRCRVNLAGAHNTLLRAL